jgi:hypothetical protein
MIQNKFAKRVTQFNAWIVDATMQGKKICEVGATSWNQCVADDPRISKMLVIVP